jgi:hypothetical protein
MWHSSFGGLDSSSSSEGAGKETCGPGLSWLFFSVPSSSRRSILQLFRPKDHIFRVLDFLGIEADRLCGVTALLRLLVCLGLLDLIHLIGLEEPIVSSLSLPLPSDVPNHFDFLLGLAGIWMFASTWIFGLPTNTINTGQDGVIY